MLITILLESKILLIFDVYKNKNKTDLKDIYLLLFSPVYPFDALHYRTRLIKVKWPRNATFRFVCSAQWLSPLGIQVRCYVPTQRLKVRLATFSPWAGHRRLRRLIDSRKPPLVVRNNEPFQILATQLQLLQRVGLINYLIRAKFLEYVTLKGKLVCTRLHIYPRINSQTIVP